MLQKCKHSQLYDFRIEQTSIFFNHLLAEIRVPYWFQWCVVFRQNTVHHCLNWGSLDLANSKKWSWREHGKGVIRSSQVDSQYSVLIKFSWKNFPRKCNQRQKFKTSVHFFWPENHGQHSLIENQWRCLERVKFECGTTLLRTKFGVTFRVKEKIRATETVFLAKPTAFWVQASCVSFHCNWADPIRNN